jgi:hypothetical protein
MPQTLKHLLGYLARLTKVIPVILYQYSDYFTHVCFQGRVISYCNIYLYKEYIWYKIQYNSSNSSSFNLVIFGQKAWTIAHGFDRFPLIFTAFKIFFLVQNTRKRL